jgi:hypothetical protein
LDAWSLEQEALETTCDNQSQLVAGCTSAADDILDNELPGEVLPAKTCPLTANANPATCAPLLLCSATRSICILQQQAKPRPDVAGLFRDIGGGMHD